MRLLATVLLGAIAIGSAGQARQLNPTHIDVLARTAMRDTGAKGLAIAVITQGRVKSAQAFGVRNAKGEPLTQDTVMYGASLTKAVFAYTVMQLVDEGKVDLDRTIGAMLPKLLPAYGNLDAYGNWGDLAGDERWRKLTPRMLLTHSSGFANFAWVEPDEKLRIHFDPGSRYAYSGEGVILLQFALEQGLGLNIGAEVQRRVFDRFGMTNSGMMWRSDFARNLADGWMADGKVEPHDERSRVRAAGSMDTSIADMANFARRNGARRGIGRQGEGRDAARAIADHIAVAIPDTAPRSRARATLAGPGGRIRRGILHRAARSRFFQGRA